jgi:hypothetical protein
MAYEVETILKASDAVASDHFGFSVSCSADGSVIVVGAYGVGSTTGKVYVYSGSSWATETQLTASDATVGDQFGNAVACSADGTVIVVGAIGEDGAGFDLGKAYVYSGTSWGTETQLTASDGANQDLFGFKVACSEDGSVVVVSAPRTGTNVGEAYVYSGASWGTETILTASDAANQDQFGSDVACSGDGATVFVGAQGEAGAGTNRGKVYVYTGGSWGTETQLTASDTGDGDLFGYKLSCSGDGTIVAVSAVSEDGAGTDRGKVYVYSGSSWGTETMLTASDTANGNFFGYDVACSGDGATVVVGANAIVAGFIGKVYVYTGASWGTETKLAASDQAANDEYGTTVACSNDAENVVVGAPQGFILGKGKAYVYGSAFLSQIYRRL